MDLSIVTTLYQSEAFVAAFHARVTAAARSLSDRWELIYVVDGATDGSLREACRVAAGDPHVVVVELARNFGHHPAIMAGLARARGERVFLVDVDLEEPPELLLPFWAALDGGDWDVVFGQQARRKGGTWERWSGAVFYRLFNRLSGLDLPPSLLTVRLMRRRYVDALLQYREREFCFGPVAAHAGFRQRALPVVKGSRPGSTYTFARKLALTLRAVTSFSDRPLTLLAVLGLAILLLSGAALGWALLTRFALGRPVPGFTSLLISIWFLGGLSVFAIGVTGLYVGRVFREVKGRPSVLVRAVHAAGAAGVPGATAADAGAPAGEVALADGPRVDREALRC
ncbi:MAG TPA: glycosyltransferase family 2 protein [Candidatus Krumholzibacteria bacterium]|nr:glycosyltransferase family 2 protein [Candidatus Krumholzibacteria bacterium]HPD71797.1 glycosyltransferase family 2 protein [Candidatus Krumholzibacteria bacterium]HRY41270.1 glycosyltransferase family 2 protein [Candidatus Krumholzibacteria bacterium]